MQGRKLFEWVVHSSSNSGKRSRCELARKAIVLVSSLACQQPASTSSCRHACVLRGQAQQQACHDASSKTAT